MSGWKNPLRNVYVGEEETVKELHSLIVEHILHVALHDKLRFKGHFTQDYLLHGYYFQGSKICVHYDAR